MKILLALLLVCVGGLAAIHAKTDGFSLVTTESARRADIARTPRALPDAALLTESGQRVSLLRNLRDDGRLTVINFVYTRCISICLAMGGEMQQLQNALQDDGLDGRVRILSLSFDPADTPQRLARYATGMQANDHLWQFAGMPDAGQRKALLNAFGIIVIPAPYGQFEHNAAYHIVTPDGHLTQVLDIGNPDELLAYLAVRLRGHVPQGAVDATPHDAAGSKP